MDIKTLFAKSISPAFILSLLVVSMVVMMTQATVGVHGLAVKDMKRIYIIVKTHTYKDGNVLSYTVQFYYVKGYVGDKAEYWYAGFVRLIPDPRPDSYVNSFEASFKDMLGILALYDASPLNPHSCIQSITEAVSATFQETPDGPTVSAGLSTSITWDPNSLSIRTPSTYPKIRWVFEPCNKSTDLAWKGSALVMYETSSTQNPKIQVLLGAYYTHCWLIFCWTTGHFHLWNINLKKTLGSS